MGFPSEGKEAAYRNPRTEVYRFLETFHKDCYRVYNLCSERSYDPSVFHGRVARYPFDDHNCPPLHLIYECCRDIDAWLKSDPRNVAVIHCKAGKGRTGVIISCYLQYNNEWPDADSALAFYAAARTYNQKGVTIPSQLRYVRYFGDSLKRKGGYVEPPAPKTLLLKEIIFRDFVSPGELKFVVQAHGISAEPATLRSWKDAGTHLTLPSSKKDTQDVSFALHPPLPVYGDILISLSGKPVFFHFWVSTAMLSGTSLVLQKAELDKANKDKKKVFPQTFSVQLNYTEEVKNAQAANRDGAAKINARKKFEIKYPSLMIA